jgi:hypothetical protein
MTRISRLAPLALAAFLGACDNESLIPPTFPGLADPLFVRYVAFGNSITAGFQSGGINDSLQTRSYAALLAGQMGTEFNIPLLNRPGCPPPLTNLFAQTLLGPPLLTGCAFRNPAVPEHLNLVAVPGAAVLDAYNPLGSGNKSNTLTTIIGGGRSQVANAAEVMPTFVTAWVGNNDALGAILDDANPGNPALVTAPAEFAARYAAFMDSLDAYGTIEGGVLIGAVQVGLAPYLSQGRAWKQFELGFDAQSAPLNFFDVTAACLAGQEIPGTTDTAWTSVPFAKGAPILAEANAKVDSVQGGLLAPGNVVPATIDCAVDTDVITVNEMLNLFSSVAQYNAAIAAEAQARDWIFIDPNALLTQLAGTPGAILPFPTFTDQASPAPFGSALSLDGIHPSTSTHVLVANALIQAINAKYGTGVPVVN